jgi:hypothetical protein
MGTWPPISFCENSFFAFSILCIAVYHHHHAHHFHLSFPDSSNRILIETDLTHCTFVPTSLSLPLRHPDHNLHGITPPKPCHFRVPSRCRTLLLPLRLRRPSQKRKTLPPLLRNLKTRTRPPPPPLSQMTTTLIALLMMTGERIPKARQRRRRKNRTRKRPKALLEGNQRVMLVSLLVPTSRVGKSVLTNVNRKAPSQETRPQQACQSHWYVSLTSPFPSPHPPSLSHPDDDGAIHS